MDIENLLTTYGPALGYLVLFLGSLFEGETIVLTAGYFAYKGYLSLSLIIIVAFLGSTIADQSLFLFGRSHGMKWINKRPSVQARAERAFKLLHKYNFWFIVGFRFIYGIRTVSPFVIGASGISLKRFAILNVCAALVWAILSCVLGYSIGYFFADSIKEGLAKVIQYQKIIIISIVGIIISFIIIKKYFWNCKKDNK